MPEKSKKSSKPRPLGVLTGQIVIEKKSGFSRGKKIGEWIFAANFTAPIACYWVGSKR